MNKPTGIGNNVPLDRVGSLYLFSLFDLFFKKKEKSPSLEEMKEYGMKKTTKLMREPFKKTEKILHCGILDREEIKKNLENKGIKTANIFGEYQKWEEAGGSKKNEEIIDGLLDANKKAREYLQNTNGKLSIKGLLNYIKPSLAKGGSGYKVLIIKIGQEIVKKKQQLETLIEQCGGRDKINQNKNNMKLFFRLFFKKAKTQRKGFCKEPWQKIDKVINNSDITLTHHMGVLSIECSNKKSYCFITERADSAGVMFTKRKPLPFMVIRKQKAEAETKKIRIHEFIHFFNEVISHIVHQDYHQYNVNTVNKPLQDEITATITETLQSTRTEGLLGIVRDNGVYNHHSYYEKNHYSLAKLVSNIDYLKKISQNRAGDLWRKTRKAVKIDIGKLSEKGYKYAAKIKYQKTNNLTKVIKERKEVVQSKKGEQFQLEHHTTWKYLTYIMHDLGNLFEDYQRERNIITDTIFLVEEIRIPRLKKSQAGNHFCQQRNISTDTDRYRVISTLFQMQNLRQRKTFTERYIRTKDSSKKKGRLQEEEKKYWSQYTDEQGKIL